MERSRLGRRRTAGCLLAAGALAGLAGLAGCGGSGGVPAGELGNLVLRRADVGRAFSPFYVGREVRLDNAGTRRADPARFGRKGGWVARFHRAGSSKTRGPLVVESRADVFGGSGGARSELETYTQDFATVPATEVHRFTVPRLGDEAVAVTYVRAGPLPVRTYTIAWRDRNVAAMVTAQGFDGKLDRQAAVRLARAQERLIAGA